MQEKMDLCYKKYIYYDKNEFMKKKMHLCEKNCIYVKKNEFLCKKKFVVIIIRSHNLNKNQ